MRGGLLADANVVIDYVEVRRHVLALASRHVAPVKVLRDLLETEIACIDEKGRARLGVEVVAASASVAVAATANRRPGLTFNDTLCLLTAREERWTCLTNDKPLRRECTRLGVPVTWGLELLAELHVRNVMSRATARALARRLHDIDPRRVTTQLLHRFDQRLNRKR